MYNKISCKNDASMPILTGIKAIPKTRHSLYDHWGVSIDIGTTTLCAALVSKDTYETVVHRNPQIKMGTDVISRINKALHGEQSELKSTVQAVLSDMIDELAEMKKIKKSEIESAVITGNTTMLYLLTGKSPKSLASAPFAADYLFGEKVPAKNIHLALSESAMIYLPKCISAFIGADIVTAILASGMCESGKTALLMDIGTNGEIVLKHNGKLFCASAAAGPAFEGYGLSGGSYGVKGAIDKVWHSQGKICCSTIGNAPASGICGSGIIDALSVMLDLDLLEETGYLESPVMISEDIFVTAEDVQYIQLAKGAIRAGVETLVKEAGIHKNEIEDFYIAGGFGNSINPENAAKIGLIPHELKNKVQCIGNAAHTGATMLLQNEQLINKTLLLTESAAILPLESSVVFRENFLQYMMFIRDVS
ncbi:MAG: ASKHA domain-containing protein [Lachnoclostridium sp.]|nr:ASKHA domain-containing protein [Lachnoclostridium sp.]